MVGGPVTLTLRLLFAALLILVGVAYVRGWRQLPGRVPEIAHTATYRRSLVSFLLGLCLLAVVTVTPLADLSLRYFSARSMQHMILVASVPAFLVMANPVPALMLGMPQGLRLRASAWWNRASLSWLRRFVFWYTRPGVTLLSFLCVCWFWYDPRIHQATLRHGWVHALEIVSLLGISLLNWWHISGAWPRTHGLMQPILRILYTTVSIWPLKIVGLILLFIPTRFYDYPETWRFSGLAIDDYIFGAMVTWIVGGAAYVMTAILLMREWLMEEEGKPILPESAWATDEALLAPHLKR
jgi:cytochrome c oxidase assembly factor CtaG